MSAHAMPFTVRAELLIRQGKARSFSEACSLLAKRRRHYGKTTVRKSADVQAVESPRVARLPYADN